MRTTLGSMASRCMLSQHSSARRSCPHLMHTFMSAECVCTLRGTLRFCMSADSCSARSSCSAQASRLVWVSILPLHIMQCYDTDYEPPITAGNLRALVPSDVHLASRRQACSEGLETV